MNDLAAYKFFLSENDIDIGDKVRVLRAPEPNEYNCDIAWSRGSSKTFVNKVYKVKMINQRGNYYLIAECGTGVWAPVFVLEKVDLDTPVDRILEAYPAHVTYHRGDLVEVITTAESMEHGWETSWIDPEMSDCVGTILEVLKDEGEMGVELDTPYGIFYFPHFVLETVERQKTPFVVGDR